MVGFGLGADPGGNTTAVAAVANVVEIGIAARHRQPISFWEFTTYGLLVTAVTQLIGWPYVWAGTTPAIEWRRPAPAMAATGSTPHVAMR